MTMLKLCRCNKAIPIQDKSCSQCSRSEDNKLYDKHRRDKQSTQFYNSKAWRVISEQAYGKQYGLCQVCLQNNKITTGTYDSKGNFKRNIVDHKVPIKQDWSKRLDFSNLWVLCIRCHNKKTAEDKKSYG